MCVCIYVYFSGDLVCQRLLGSLEGVRRVISSAAWWAGVSDAVRVHPGKRLEEGPLQYINMSVCVLRVLPTASRSLNVLLCSHHAAFAHAYKRGISHICVILGGLNILFPSRRQGSVNIDCVGRWESSGSHAGEA